MEHIETTIVEKNVIEHIDDKGLPANLSWWQYLKIDLFGRNYCNFKGRASRREFWAVSMLQSILSILIIGICTYTQIIDAKQSKLLSDLLSLYSFLPLFALNVRRLHDINLSGWWLLLFIPSFFCPFFKGNLDDNKYGNTIYEKKDEPTYETNKSILKILKDAMFGNNFFNLKGRASRKEFLTIVFCLCVIPLGIYYIYPSIVNINFLIFYFVCLIPYPIIGVIVRRFHDINMSGKMALLILPILILPFISSVEESNT